MGRSKRSRKGSDHYNLMAQIKKEERAQKKFERNERRKEAKKQNMEKKYLVGFYGDYKLNTKDHMTLKKNGAMSKLIGQYYTEPEYALYQIKGAGESALLPVGECSVLMEVYEINESLLAQLDILHGFDIYQTSCSYYNREEITSPFGNIYVYFWNDFAEKSDILVEQGDWLDFLKTANVNTNINKNLEV